MSQGYLSGVYEHTTRYAPHLSVAQIHAESAAGALNDAGLTFQDVDGYFCAGDAPGLGPLSMVDYLGINPRYIDSTDIGGASYLMHVARAVQAIERGLCNVALITLGGKPKSESSSGLVPRSFGNNVPDAPFELPYEFSIVSGYGMAAARHMYEFGTTSEQLAWVKVAAAHHAQHNPHAVFRKPLTVDDVLASPMVSDPLRRLDCCVVTDGGGAVVVCREEIARSLGTPQVRMRGFGAAIKATAGGRVDLTHTAARFSGKRAFDEAGVGPRDIQYASIYDSFTITVIMQLEDLGFCEKGKGGAFVADGNLISGVGSLPFNTDGGGLCNNHPSNRGGITKIIEAVRQLRGEAHPAVQVANCELALVQGIGGNIGSRHGSATLILERV